MTLVFHWTMLEIHMKVHVIIDEKLNWKEHICYH